MEIEKKLDVLDWMKIHYLDRECLNKTEEKELDNFVNELKEAINYNRCCAELPETLCRFNTNFKCNCTYGVNCNNFDEE